MMGGDRSNMLGDLMPAPPQQDRNKENQMQQANQRRQPAQLQRPASGMVMGGGGVTNRQHKLKQRFTVIRKLGKGTYGKVQLAINKETGQEVAIKTIKKTKIENEQDLQRVRREIQIMSSIEHPHIIHIYEVFENKDKIVLVMQYAPGGELYEYVSQAKLLDDVEARRLFRQVATAIYYCHQNKICHRDLKLENILLDEKNNAKLADFGLSNVFDKHRQLRTFCGSPLYASPEIVQGSPYEGPEVDCWSLGVLLYTLVYGAMPFDGSNFKRLVKQISEACYYEPKQRSQASPLIRRLLCADPTRRANILDICSDPWVNGVTPISPQLSPTAGAANQQQQQPAQSHNSLLKVAQDMANLTPVRFDILLALAAPVSPPAATAAAAAGVDASRTPLARLDSTNDGNVQAAGEVPPADKRPPHAIRRPASQMNLNASSMMMVDEAPDQPPIASYIVRDLDAPTETIETTAPSNSADVSTTTTTPPPPPQQPVLADAEEKMENDTAIELVDAGDDKQEVAELSVHQLESVGTIGVIATAQNADTNDDSSRRASVAASGEQPSLPQPSAVEVGATDGLQTTTPRVKMEADNEHSSTTSVEPEQTVAPGGVQNTEDVGKAAQEQEPTIKDEPHPLVAAEESAGADQEPHRTASDVDVKMEVDTQPQTDEQQTQQVGNVPLPHDTNEQLSAAAEGTGTRTAAEQDTGQNAEKPEAAATTIEEKPKKMKKKVVVVKKKKKVSKREAAPGNGEQQPVGNDKSSDSKKSADKEESSPPKPASTKSAAAEETTITTGEQGAPTATTSTTTNQTAIKPKGPGKVRIPNTFQAPDNSSGNNNNTSTSQPASRATPTEAPNGRRQSALVADVSQKLLQHVQQQGASSGLNTEEQAQLASVKVSDKKSEFERRASLATTPAGSAPQQPRVGGSHHQQQQQDGEKTVGEQQEPQKEADHLRESLNVLGPVEQTVGEQVYRQQPQEATSCPAAALALPSVSAVELEQQLEPEPKTPTGDGRVELRAAERATEVSGVCAGSDSNDQAPKSPSLLSPGIIRDDRSDSVETIRPESADGGVSPTAESPIDVRLQPAANVRSTLKIDLGPRDGGHHFAASAAESAVRPETTTSSLSSSSSAAATTSLSGGRGAPTQAQATPAAGSVATIGPAPIARSYKKVTFTRDGARITETGKIYSAQADDGTLRRIERKSKVTHYPTESGQAAQEASEETQEEIIYGGGAEKVWQESSSLFQSSSSATPMTAASSNFGAGSAAHRRPAPAFERLIMPSSGDPEQFFDNYDDFMMASGGGRSSFSRPPQHQQQQQQSAPPERPRTDSASSCSSGSTDVFDDIFDTWTGAISMFQNQGRRMSGFQTGNSLFDRATRDPHWPHDHASGSGLFGGATLRRRKHQQQQQGHHHVSSSLAGTPRCDSAEPQHLDARRANRRHQRRPNHDEFGGASASGYESDAPFDNYRPASACLGSARGPIFGSSNLAGGSAGTSRRTAAADPFDAFFDQPLPLADFEPIGHKLDPFGAGSMLHNIEQEHLNLKRRLAQQHKQLWKGSTPSLFSPFGGGDNMEPLTQRAASPAAQSGSTGGGRRQHGMWPQFMRESQDIASSRAGAGGGGQPAPREAHRAKSTSGSQSCSIQQQQQQHSPWSHHQAQAHQQQQQHRPPRVPTAATATTTNTKEQCLEQSQSSSSFLRQSVALDSAPTRKNTSNSIVGDYSHQHNQPIPVRQFNHQHQQHEQQQPMHRSISRTSMVSSSQTAATSQAGTSQMRTTSEMTSEKQAASFIELKRTNSSSASSAIQRQQQQQQQMESAVTTTTSRIVSATSGSSSATFWDNRATPVVSSGNTTAATDDGTMGRSMQDTEADSRIQNWLQESAGNLSSSSGFKSSASDTLPTNERNDPFANLYGSLRPKRENVSSGSGRGLQSAGPSLLPPRPQASSRGAGGRSESDSQVKHSTSSTIFVTSSSAASSSRQSIIHEGQQQTASEQRQEEEAVHHRESSTRLREVVDSATSPTPLGAGASGQSLSRASSSTKVTRATFTLRQKSPCTTEATAAQLLVDCGDTSPAETGLTSKHLVSRQVQQHHQQQQVSESSSFSRVSLAGSAPIVSKNVDGLNWIQTVESGSRLFGDDLEDSLSGAGSADLESQSSSSLLDQLRSRGYRSMINQRMVSHSSGEQVVQQQQQQQQIVERSSSRVVTSTSSAARVVQHQVFTTTSGATSTKESSSSTRFEHHEQDQNDNTTQVISPLQVAMKTWAPQEVQESVKLTTMRNELLSCSDSPGADQSNQQEQSSGGSNCLQTATPTTATDEKEEVKKEGAEPQLEGGNNEEEDDDDDEDVREAKANIKGHLDQMKETELFLKSMQQEEENFERQRQQLFLFNNLMLSTKLNGIRHSTTNNDNPSSGFMMQADNERPNPIGARSAPIRSQNFLGPSLALESQTNGFLSGSAALSSSFEPAYAPIPPYQPSAISLNYMSSSSFAPTRRLASTHHHPTESFNGCTEMGACYDGRDSLAHDPLEPVQPLGYLDIFAAAPHTPPLSSIVPSVDRRFRRSRSQLSDQFDSYKRRTPLNAGLIDLSGGGVSETTTPDAYSRSRARRSVSQLRYGSSSSNRYSQPAVMSEYRSAYGGGGGAGAGASKNCSSPAKCGESDESDDGMSAYRVSSYVPKVVPQGIQPARGRTYQRRSYSGSTAGSVSSYYRRDDSKELKSHGDADDSLEREATKRERRTSLQTGPMNGCAEDLYAGSRRSAARETLSPTYRRRSVATPGAAENLGSSSRLSELEQRIQENKRRREELLAGKLSPQAPRKKSEPATRPEMAPEDEVGRAMPAARVAREVSPAASISPARSKLTRPSRLESMEARIKRKSYCVRMGNCSPERGQLRGQQQQQSLEKWRQSNSGNNNGSAGASNSGRILGVSAGGSSRSSLIALDTIGGGDSWRKTRRDSKETESFGELKTKRLNDGQSATMATVGRVSSRNEGASVDDKSNDSRNHPLPVE